MLTCCVCGSPHWMAVAPGTAPDASRFTRGGEGQFMDWIVPGAVVELIPAEAVPTRAWCLEHWRSSWVPAPDRPAEDEIAEEAWMSEASPCR